MRGRAVARRVFQVESVTDDVARLRMDDGKVNAISPTWVTGARAAWQEATSGDRAVILRGNAKAFSAGLDLKVVPFLEPEEMARFAADFTALFGEIATYARPVVAAVDGPALAGGAMLALCADARIVTQRARLGLTEVAVGIPFPEPILALARTTLPANEHGPALLGAMIREGEACVTRGWADACVDATALDAASERVATTLATHSRRAYAITKTALRSELASAFDGFVKDGASAWAGILADDETRADVLAAFARATSK